MTYELYVEVKHADMFIRCARKNGLSGETEIFALQYLIAITVGSKLELPR